MTGRLSSALAALLATLTGAAAPATGPAAPAARQDQYCTSSSYASGPQRAARLRFGVDPGPAGSAGGVQTQPKPVNDAKAFAALHALTPPGSRLVLRENRLFWSDGAAGIRRFRRLVARNDREGFDSEIQVRYHPPPGHEDDIPGWVRYVRRVVRALGRDPHMVAMTITNEVNLDISKNTSDGAYAGATDALIRGIIAAHAEAGRIGRPDLRFGFTFAYRWNPASDARFWETLGAAPPAFRRALGFVGVDDYPGTFWPPVIAPTSSPGHELVLALATVRRCFMPKARLGVRVPIWVTENGYDSGALGNDAAQAAALRDMVRSAASAAGSYGVTDYRWFNLRDNVTRSPAIFDTTGLLHDDYSRKPAFGSYRRLIRSLGR